MPLETRLWRPRRSRTSPPAQGGGDVPHPGRPAGDRPASRWATRRTTSSKATCSTTTTRWSLRPPARGAGQGPEVGLARRPERPPGRPRRRGPGRIVRWRPGKVLTYTVLRDSFPSQADYDLAVDCTAQATQAWMEVCGIVFAHLSQHDGHADVSASPDEISPDLTFTVRYIDAGEQFIASAFFPTYPRPGAGPDRPVVLRRGPDLRPGRRAPPRAGPHARLPARAHPQRGAPACPDEPTYDTLDLTAYDPQSVMHYFWAGRFPRAGHHRPGPARGPEGLRAVAVEHDARR